MRRWAAFLALVWCVAWAGAGIYASGTANNPNSPNAITVQGPDPTGNDGYPVSVVNATGTTLDVNVASGGGGVVTQGTSPWIVGFGGIGQPVTQSGAWSVSATQGTSPWIVNGSGFTQPVSGTFWQATQPVSGTFWQATQPVSGTVTANQGTSPWVVNGSGFTQPVSGTFWQATQPVSGTFWQATQPVSGTFWQATQPVSGTVAATQSGTWTVQQGTPPWSVTGTHNTFTDAPANTLQAFTGYATAGTTTPLSGSMVPLSIDTLNGALRVTKGDLLSWKVDGSAVTQPVSGTFWQATQPVSGTLAGTLTNNNAAPGATNLGTLPALANAAAPTWTEGNQTTLSTNLAGRLRVDSSLGTSEGKTNVLKTGTVTTTAVTADQVVLTYTVTGGKTFYLEYLTVSADNSAVSATGAIIGEFSLESAAGTKLVTDTLQNPTTEDRERFTLTFPEPIPIAASTVIRVVCTPAATTSFKWRANFGGYEK